MTDPLASPNERCPIAVNDEQPESPPLSGDHLRTPSQHVPLWSVPVALLLLSLLCMATLDAPVAHWIKGHSPFRPIRAFLEAAEYFGTPAGQFLFLLAVGWSARPTLTGEPKLLWDVRVPRIYVGALISGLAANAIKICIGRTRPRAFAFDELSIWDGFGPYFAMGAGGSSAQSFPSAHTACAFGFAVLLSWAWPERRRIFYLLAAFVGMQRIMASAHFPSDVLAGAAVGWLTAQMYVRDGLVFRWWTKLERRLARWQQARQT